MKPRGGALVYLALTAGVAAVLWGARCGPGARTDSSPPVAAVGADGAAARGPVAGEEGRALFGVVLSAGRAAGGATVTLCGARGEKTIQADGEGRFRFAPLEPGRYSVRASRGQKAAYLDDLSVGTTPVVIALRPATSVSGRLLAKGGGPVVDGEVELTESAGIPRRAKSDATGRFEFSAVLPGGYIVTARATDFRPLPPQALQVATAPVALTLRLTPGAALHGRVVNEAGSGVAGATLAVAGEAADGAPIAVSARASAPLTAPLEPMGELGRLPGPIPYPPAAPSLPSEAPSSAFTTDATGRFRLHGLPAGRLLVVATHPEYARGRSATLRLLAGQSGEVTVVLHRGVRLGGRVVDDGGQAVVAAELVGEFGVLARTDGEGQFSLDHVVDPLAVTVRADGFLPVTRTLSPKERGAIEVIVPRAQGRLAGQVVDDRGLPLQGARLTITAAASAPRQVSADRRGHFSADGLGAGPYAVTVAHPDYAPARFAAVAAADDARFALTPGGGIDGDVRDARTGAVPDEAQLTILPVSGPTRRIPVVRGRFQATALPPGRAIVTASAPGYVTWSRPVEITAGETLHAVTVRDLVIELMAGGEVVGEVRDETGPVAKAQVVAAGLHTRTDEEGRFRLAGLPPGPVRLMAQQGTARASVEVMVQANDQVRLELQLTDP